VIALGMMFVDQIRTGAGAAMTAELIRALQASLSHGNVPTTGARKQGKAGIAALLGNVARLLLVMIDSSALMEISRRVEAGPAS